MRFKEGYDYLSGDLNNCQAESMKQTRVVQFGCPDNDILFFFIFLFLFQ